MAPGTQLALEPARDDDDMRADRWPLLYSTLLVLGSSMFLWALIIAAGRALLGLVWS